MELGNVFSWEAMSSITSSRRRRRRQRELDDAQARINAGRQPSLELMVGLAGVWTRRGSAVMRVEGHGLAYIAEGEALNRDSLLLCELALTGSRASLELISSRRERETVSGLTDLLWFATQRWWTSAHEVLACTSHELHDGPALGQLEELPLRMATSSIVAGRRAGVSLAELLREAQIDPSQVATEISALTRLGVLELRRQEPAHCPQPETSEAEEVPLRAWNTQDLERRARIMAKVNPWRALGLRPYSSQDEMNASMERLRGLYEVHPNHRPRIRLALERINLLLTRIARDLGEQSRASHQARTRGTDPLLVHGISLLSRNGATAAVELLSQGVAQNPTSGHHHAWYGWALFKSPGTPLAVRAARAMKHLETALRCEQQPEELPHFLATIEAALARRDEGGVGHVPDLVALDQLDDDEDLLFGECPD